MYLGCCAVDALVKVNEEKCDNLFSYKCLTDLRKTSLGRFTEISGVIHRVQWFSSTSSLAQSINWSKNQPIKVKIEASDA